MGQRTIVTSDLIDRVMEFKDEAGMSDRGLADLLGISHGTPSNWRRGVELHLDHEMQMVLSRTLKISPLEVLRLHGLSVSADMPDDDGQTPSRS